MNKWVSVKDELPEEEGMYLCAFDDHTIETFEFNSAMDAWKPASKFRYHVTHWMPLPDFPDE